MGPSIKYVSTLQLFFTSPSPFQHLFNNTYTSSLFPIFVRPILFIIYTLFRTIFLQWQDKCKRVAFGQDLSTTLMGDGNGWTTPQLTLMLCKKSKQMFRPSYLTTFKTFLENRNSQFFLAVNSILDPGTMKLAEAVELYNIGVHWQVKPARMPIPMYVKDRQEPLENVLRAGNVMVILVTW